MADIKLVWNQELGRADWTVIDGRLAAGDDLETAVILCLFTDRVAQPDYVPTDRTGDRRGWWGDSLAGVNIGSRLWQLERRKIVDRGALAAEAKGMCDEALAPLVRQRIARSITTVASLPPAGAGGGGNLLVLQIAVVQPNGVPLGLRYAYTLT